MNCPKCGIALVENTAACPKCNAPVEAGVVDINDIPPTDAPNLKAIGGTLGFCNGLVGFVLLVVLATFAVMNGYHYEYLFAAIAICVPVITGLRGMLLFRQGQCPHCQKITNGNVAEEKLLKCKVCKKKFKYKDGKFWAVAN